jgi:uncharacterized protein YutD
MHQHKKKLFGGMNNMKTGEIISIAQIRDEYLSLIKDDLDNMNNPQFVQQLVQMLNHFSYIIQTNDILLVKVIDIIEHSKERQFDEVQNINEQDNVPEEYIETRGRPRKYSEEQNVEEKPKEFTKQDVGMNPAEIKLKEEYERKIKELNSQIKMSDDAVKEKQYNELEMNIRPPPSPEPSKTNFLDKLRPSK